jgi:uncharacterized protein (DUF2141 family)
LVIEIHNIKINGGTLFCGIYFSESTYKNNAPDISFEIDPVNQTMFKEIMLPERECVIGIYQDTNSNAKLDLGIFNIPKEPVGITNYNGGIPGNFNKLKIDISDNIRRVNIKLFKF